MPRQVALSEVRSEVDIKERTPSVEKMIPGSSSGVSLKRRPSRESSESDACHNLLCKDVEMAIQSCKEQGWADFEEILLKIRSLK